MLQSRFIPVLQLHAGTLVKTVRFGKPAYVGDPVNTVRIFNELEADEMCFLDIRATVASHPPDFSLLRQLSDESFCPLMYGGGVASEEIAAQLFAIGFEKVVLNTALHTKPNLLETLTARYGSQAVVAGIDVKRCWLHGTHVYTHSGTRRTRHAVVDFAKVCESRGAGEILLTSVDREGTWRGMDVATIRAVADAVHIPVVANGGAGSVAHVAAAIREGHASAVAAGSMVVYQQQGMGVLVHMPDRATLDVAMGE